MRLCLWVCLLTLPIVTKASLESMDSTINNSGNHHVQCWQNGIKIIDEEHLSNYKNFLPLSSSQVGASGIVSFGFNKINSNQKITILDLNRTTCMIKDEK